MPAAYHDSVFLNVPFDKKYLRLSDALVFAIHDCGFIARSALEVDDSGQARVLKVLDIIEQSKYGIHDISRAGIDKQTGWRASICRWSSVSSLALCVMERPGNARNAA